MIFAIALMISLPQTSSANGIRHDQTCFVVDNSLVAPVAIAQEEGGGSAPVVDPNTTEVAPTGNFFTNNWIALLGGILVFIELIVRLTPSEKDNSIFNWLAALINALIPNLKKGGGTFKVSSN